MLALTKRVTPAMASHGALFLSNPTAQTGSRLPALQHRTPRHQSARSGPGGSKARRRPDGQRVRRDGGSVADELPPGLADGRVVSSWQSWLRSVRSSSPPCPAAAGALPGRRMLPDGRGRGRAARAPPGYSPRPSSNLVTPSLLWRLGPRSHLAQLQLGRPAAPQRTESRAKLGSWPHSVELELQREPGVDRGGSDLLYEWPIARLEEPGGQLTAGVIVARAEGPPDASSHARLQSKGNQVAEWSQKRSSGQRRSTYCAPARQVPRRDRRRGGSGGRHRVAVAGRSIRDRARLLRQPRPSGAGVRRIDRPPLRHPRRVERGRQRGDRHIEYAVARWIARSWLCLGTRNAAASRPR